MSNDIEGLNTIMSSIPFKSAILAGVLTVLRFFYDDDRRKWHRKVLETAICITVTYGVARGIKAIPGVSEDAAWLIGVGLGWWGADYVRERAKVWFKKRSERGD